MYIHEEGNIRCLKVVKKKVDADWLTVEIGIPGLNQQSWSRLNNSGILKIQHRLGLGWAYLSVTSANQNRFCIPLSDTSPSLRLRLVTNR